MVGTVGRDYNVVMPRTLHDAVRARDLKEVSRWLHMRSAVNQVEVKTGYGPLHVACTVKDVPLELVRALVTAGADVNALSEPNAPGEPRGTPLSLAVRVAPLEVVDLLIKAGGDVRYCDEEKYTLATGAAVAGRRDILGLLIEAGAPLDEVSPWGQSALSVFSSQGRFGAVADLLEAGADPAPLRWTPLHHAAALGDISDLEAALEGGADLEARDGWSRTPFLLAVHAGSVPKAKWLLEHDADPVVEGHCAKPVMAYAVDRDYAEMVRWLVEYGFNALAADQFGTSVLGHAVEEGAVACFHALVELGADPHRLGPYGKNLMADASDPAIVAALMDLGVDAADLDGDDLRELVGLGSVDILDIDEQAYRAGRLRTFGTSNPQRMDNPFWEAMVRCGWTAYQADAEFGNTSASPPATWCHSRFGMSITPLPDGRFVQIGGEHEDFYDPDFCIYNDVVVHDGHGGIAIYGYPKEVFPPTDFHTATRVEGSIYVIGSAGYKGERGTTAQVFRLDLSTFAMQRVMTTGEDPGWISRHRAALKDGCIVVEGGMRNAVNAATGHEDYVSGEGRFALDLASHRWERLVPTTQL